MTMLLLNWNPRLTFNDTRKNNEFAVFFMKSLLQLPIRWRQFTGPLKKMKKLKIDLKKVPRLFRYNDPTFYENKKSLFTIPLRTSIYLTIYIYLSIYPWYWGPRWGLPVKTSTSIYLFIYLSIYLYIYLSIYLSIYPSIYLSIYRSIYLSIIYLSFQSSNVNV